MCAMWIGKIPGNKYLVGFYFSQKINCNLYILFTHRVFFYRTGFIKRKIEKMNVFVFYSNIPAGCLCFASSYQTFNSPYFACIRLIFFLLGKKFSCVIQNFTRSTGINPGDFLKSYCKVKKTCNEFIRYSNITRSLVSSMNIMALVVQTEKSSTHTYDIIIRMWRENHDSFGMGL